MKLPSLITADALLNKDWPWTFTKAPVGDKIYSVLSRPVAQPFYQPFQRFKLAYGVLVGKYDALKWIDQ